MPIAAVSAKIFGRTKTKVIIHPSPVLPMQIWPTKRVFENQSLRVG